MEKINLKIFIIALNVMFFISFNASAQVGIGTTTPDASSMLDIQSPDNDKGVLIPRMTDLQRLAISTPANGLLVFDTTTKSFWFYNGTIATPAWRELTSGASLIDADGDTKIEVEQTPDEDKIHFSTANVAGDASVERMTIDKAGVTKIGDIAGGNDTKIEADGTLMFEGNAEVWDDLRVSMDKGSSSASLDWFPGESSGPQIWYFRDAKGLESLSFQVQLPHSYKEGTTIYPHLHWTPNASESGDVEWNLDYTWVNYNPITPQVFPAITTSTAVETGPFTQRTHLITGLTVGGVGLDGTDKKISSILICRLWRNSGNSADTYTNDAGLLSLDFHFQIDTVGSRETFSK